MDGGRGGRGGGFRRRFGGDVLIDGMELENDEVRFHRRGREGREVNVEARGSTFGSNVSDEERSG